MLVILQIKGMAQHLNRTNKLYSPRKERFSIKFMEDLETLVGAVAMEICQSHIRVRIMYNCPMLTYKIIIAGRQLCQEGEH